MLPLRHHQTHSSLRAADVNPDLSGNENDQLRAIARWFGRVRPLNQAFVFSGVSGSDSG